MNQSASEIAVAQIRYMLARLGDEAPPGMRAQLIVFLFDTISNFIQVEGFSDALCEILARENMTDELARWNQSLGRRYWMAGQYDKAEEVFIASLPLFRKLSQDANAAMCEHSLGIVYGVTGRKEASEAAYLNSRKTFACLGMERMHATCNQNLGALYLDAKRLTHAEDAFKTARSEFLKLGLIEHVARSDLSLGLAHQERAFIEELVPSRRRIMADALELLIPALLLLDSVRLTLPNSPARSAWISSVLYGTRAAFDLAAQLGDNQLVAQLVEVAINTGVHSINAWLGPKDRQQNSFRASQALSEWPVQQDAGTYSEVSKAKPFKASLPSAAVLVAAGKSRLLESALLPVGAPPLLRMPDGSIALEPYICRANEIYGTSGRSEEIINTW
jgi:hypothetical protein